VSQDYGNLQKHLNPNPVQRYLLRRFHRQIASLLKATGAERILDAGCGEGFVVSYLLQGNDGLTITGIDCSLEAIEMARQMVPPVLPVLSKVEGSEACSEPFDPSARLRTSFAQDKLRRGVEGGVLFDLGDLREMPYGDDSFDLVMCLEVLEHLPDPHRGLRELRRVTSAHCLVSVPHEPFFRATNFLRGKHVPAWGRDPEHLQHWTARQFRHLVGQYFEIPEHLQHWTARQFRHLVGQYFEIERFVYSFPWVIALGRKC
jgi:2-polyprenyl-3-methyl-5-hydroxy-6-metoxy-1,4-benzoquinol methylase